MNLPPRLLPTEEISDLLDRLVRLRIEQAQVERAYEEDCEAMLTAAQKRRRQELAYRRHTALERLQDAICGLEELIRVATVMHGASVRGQHLLAIFHPGRVTWDTAGLEGYMVAGHEELEAFRRIGEPSVSLREIR